MPLYEYQCRKCGRVLEKIQRFSDPPLTLCEKCGGKLKRLLSAPAFQFKGSGWYVTDYARKPSSTSTEKSEGSSNAEDKKDGGTPAKKDAESATPKSTTKPKGESEK